MRVITVGEFKANLSEIIKKVQKGEEYVISFGRKKKKIFKVVPFYESKSKRKLGIMEGRAKVKFASDWKMTTEEFLGM